MTDEFAQPVPRLLSFDISSVVPGGLGSWRLHSFDFTSFSKSSPVIGVYLRLRSSSRSIAHSHHPVCFASTPPPTRKEGRFGFVCVHLRSSAVALYVPALTGRASAV